MELKPVTLEFKTQNFTQALPLKVGEFINARIVQIKDQMLLLMVNNNTLIQSRLAQDLKLQPGQELVLQVRGIKADEIVLGIASVQDYKESVYKSISREYGIVLDKESISIIEKLTENGMPATADRIKEVQKAVKSVKYLVENLGLVETYPIPADWTVKKTALDEIVKWMVLNKEEPPAKTPGPAEKSVESEKFLILMKEFDRIIPEDIIRLKKFTLEITPNNIILAKNLRENKGFLDILLKILYGNGELEDTGSTEDKRYQNLRQGMNWEEKTEVSHIRNAKGHGSRIKPVDIFELLVKISEQERSERGKALEHKWAAPGLKAAAQLVSEKLIFLNKALENQNYCIFPFLFNQQVHECIIGINRKKDSSRERQPDVLELDIDTQLSFLGRVKVNIKISGKDLGCIFYVQKESIQRLIDKDAETLKRSIEKNGFRVTGISCRKLASKTQQSVDRFVDLRV